MKKLVSFAEAGKGCALLTGADRGLSVRFRQDPADQPVAPPVTSLPRDREPSHLYVLGVEQREAQMKVFS